MRLGRYDEALRCYHQAIEVAEECGDRVGLGLALAREGLLSGALERLERARALAEETGDCMVELEVLHGLGVATGTLDYHRAALELAIRLGAIHEARRAHAALTQTTSTNTGFA